MSFTGLEKTIGYVFRDKSLLEHALTHSSYNNEMSFLKNNERLEFLGDAVLELVASEYLYLHYPDKPEGELTKIRAKIVCTDSLAKASSDHGFGGFIRMGRGEEITGGRERKSILANTFEAIAGAVYLEGGLVAARKMITQLLEETMIQAANGSLIFDYKTKLQEVVQQKPGSILEYRVERESGPDHNKTFYVILFHDGSLIGRGEGSSKKEAEQQAAYQGLTKLGVLDEA